MQPLNSTVHRALASFIKDAPLTPGKIEFAWHAAVGPALARVTTRVRLRDDGVLHVDTHDRRWADEIRRSAGMIGARLNALLGEGVIKQIRAHHA